MIMGLFSKIGNNILGFFSVLGAIILAIPKIPQKLRNIDRNRVKEKIDTENLKENVSKVKNKVDVDGKPPQITNKEKTNHKNLSRGKVERNRNRIPFLSQPLSHPKKRRIPFFVCNYYPQHF
jgi:hypothetical protein